MRILICSDHYPPFIGGVQRQTRGMAIELTARGHDVCVATVWQDDLAPRENSDGYPVHRLRQLRSLPLVRGRARRRHQPPFPDPVTVVQLRRLIRGFQPELVHSSGWFTSSAAAALLGTNIPLVASARDYGLICANTTMLHKGAPCTGPGLAKCLDCSSSYHGTLRGIVAAMSVRLSAPLVRRKARGLHALSRHVRDVVARDFLGERGSRTIPQVVIPSFRLPDEERPDPTVLRRLPTEPFILFVGALRRAKGIQTLYDAYRCLEDPPPLVLLGTFERDTPSDAPPGVLTPGPASNATVLAAWDRALFGVMPSLLPEPFGSVIHEAMSRGRPVIGTSPGGHEDMIEHRQTGLLVPPADAGALRAAMQELLDDAVLRADMGRRARERADIFTAAVVIPQFEAFYERFRGQRTSPERTTPVGLRFRHRS